MLGVDLRPGRRVAQWKSSKDVPQRLDRIPDETASASATDGVTAFRDVLVRSSRFVAMPTSIEVHEQQLGWPHVGDSQLRIGVISVQLDDNGLINDSTDPNFSLWAMRPAYRSQIQGKLERLVEQACRSNCQFIIFNELAFPLDSISRKLQGPQGEKNRDEQVKAFLRRLGRLKGPEPRYLIAGSFHDPVRKYNLSPIVACTGAGVHVARLHAKRTSAVREGERVRLLAERTVNLYQTAYGRLAVMICLDLYDSSQVLSLLLHNDCCDESEVDDADSGRVDILAVPSLGMREAEAVKLAVAQVSLLLGSIVAFALSNSGEADQWVYVGGKPARVLERFPKPAAAGEGSGPAELTVFEIAGREYARARAEAKKARDALRDILSPRGTSPEQRPAVMPIS